MQGICKRVISDYSRYYATPDHWHHFNSDRSPTALKIRSLYLYQYGYKLIDRIAVCIVKKSRFAGTLKQSVLSVR